jgi:hypothetical protein
MTETLDERKFNVSFGADPPLVVMTEDLKRSDTRLSMVLVSINTCIRNAMDQEQKLDQNLKLIEQELDVIARTLSEALSASFKSSVIWFYMTNHYAKYPASVIRPVTPGKQLYFDLTQEIWKSLTVTSGYMDRTYVKYSRLIGNTSYDELLYNQIKGMSVEVAGYAYNGHYGIVTHNPLDFHVLNRGTTGRLISSHTGAVLTRKDLSVKVFDTPDVPFNGDTHFILGDKVQIKPQISPAIKKQLMAKAKSEKWPLKTDAQIRMSLRSLGIIVK